MKKTIPVLEIFGPTIQGEGAVIGTKTMFVRTAGCDYQCKWCDSAFTWDGSAKDEIKQLTAEEIWAELKILGGEKNFSHVTISGGNPALLANLSTLVSLLRENGIRIGVETQGSKWQEWLTEVQDITISPKPPSSGMATDFDKLSMIIENLSLVKENNLSLKVVVFDEEDFHYAIEIHKKYPEVPFYVQVGNDNVYGDDQSQIVSSLLNNYEWLIDQVVKSNEMNDVKVLPQLHTLVWGNKRGV